MFLLLQPESMLEAQGWTLHTVEPKTFFHHLKLNPKWLQKQSNVYKGFPDENMSHL